MKERKRGFFMKHRVESLGQPTVKISWS